MPSSKMNDRLDLLDELERVKTEVTKLDAGAGDILHRGYVEFERTTAHALVAEARKEARERPQPV